MDLTAIAEEFLAHLAIERGLSVNTTDAYRRDIDHYLEFVNGAPPTTDLIDTYLEELHFQGYAGSSTSRKLAAIRGLHRFAVTEDLGDRDPTVMAEAPKRTHSLPKALTVEEILALLDAPDLTTVVGRRAKAILEFMYATGTRVSEVVALSLHDLDLEGASVIVTGKGDKQRAVPMGSHSVAALTVWLQDRLAYRTDRSDNAVFLNQRGGRLSRQSMWNIVREAAKTAGIAQELVSPHVFRHSAATHMTEAGADLRTVQEILGHANISTTQMYTKVTPRHLLEIYVEAHPRSR
jgi:integrase/recombinase XerD